MTGGAASLVAAALAALAAALWGERPDQRLRRSDRPPFLARLRAKVRRRPADGARSRRATLMLTTALTIATLVLTGPVALVPSVVLTGCVLVFRRRHRAARRMRLRQREDRDDVAALRALAAELRSGLPAAQALEIAAGAGAVSGLRKRMLNAATADRLGGDPAEALARSAPPGSAAAGVAAAWAVCQVTGASLAAPVARIADAAASGLLLVREADAALASARSSARLLALLPVAGVGIGVLSGTGSLRVLLTTGPGQLCLLAGAALELAGLTWLDRLAGAGE